MSLFNNLKNILGFPETENENTADMQESVERTPYINPFKDETHHVPAPSEEPANQRPSLSIADIDEKMRMKIIEKLIDILNTSLPDYTKKYIDRNAQIQYIRQLIAADFDEAMSEIIKKCEESAKKEWLSDRIEMEQKIADAAKQAKEASERNESQKNRMMSLERQKAALNERIAALEAKTATAEAEKEQFQLETKSLMNKLKVSAVNEAEIKVVQEECEALKIEKDALLKKIEQLDETILTLKNQPAAENQQADSTLAEEIEKYKTVISGLQASIQRQNDEMYALNRQLAEKGTDMSLRDEINKLKNELASKTHEAKLFAEKAEETDKLARQLKESAERTQKQHADEEEKLRTEIESLRNENASLQKQLEKKTAKKSIDMSVDTVEESEPKHVVPEKKKQTTVSAIDYSSEYTDWLLPTPPSVSIPIEEDEEPEEKPAGKQEKRHAGNPNAPEQMELFT